jgi:hypothetical protein
MIPALILGVMLSTSPPELNKLDAIFNAPRPLPKLSKPLAELNHIETAQLEDFDWSGIAGLFTVFGLVTFGPMMIISFLLESNGRIETHSQYQ